jgi:hypothetical protein
VTGLVTGQTNESCNPDDFGLYGGNLHLGSYTVRVGSDGTFKTDVTINGTIDINGDSDPTTDHITITGKFNGVTATATLLDITQFTDQKTSIAYTCSSNPQTWTATKS